MMMLTKEDVLRNKKPLSEEKMCCIYFLIKKDEIVYVGQTTKGISRVYAHLGDKDFDSYAILGCKEDELNDLEAYYIVEFNPCYNGTPPNNSMFVGKPTMKKRLRIEGRAFNALLEKYQVKIYPKNQLKITEIEAAFKQAQKDGFIYYHPSSMNDWFLAKRRVVKC